MISVSGYKNSIRFYMNKEVLDKFRQTFGDVRKVRMEIKDRTLRITPTLITDKDGVKPSVEGPNRLLFKSGGNPLGDFGATRFYAYQLVRDANGQSMVVQLPENLPPLLKRADRPKAPKKTAKKYKHSSNDVLADLEHLPVMKAKTPEVMPIDQANLAIHVHGQDFTFAVPDDVLFRVAMKLSQRGYLSENIDI